VGGRVVARGTVHHADGRQSLRVLLQGAGPTRAEVPVDGLPEVDLLRSMLVCGNRAVLAGRADAGVLRDAWLVGDEPKAAARRVRWGIPGLPDLAVRTALQKAAGRLGAVADALPATVVSALAVPSAAEAWAGAAVADGATRERLEAEELLHAQLGLCWARFAPGRERGISHTVGSSLPARVFDAMGLDHSVAVATAAERIRRDLRRSAPMRRVLVGSPGSGPWRTALWSLLSVVESKAQAVVLSDDFALMEEMFAAFEEALRDADVACRLVGGPPTTGVRGALKRGEIGVVFGTADLLDPALEWRRLGLVVSIERSPSGASARQVASLRAPRPDLLVLAGSAPTPAQALGLLGDHDFTILPEPESNPRVRVYADAGRAAAVGEVAEVLAARRRAVMIIPQVEGRDVFGRREAHEMAAALQAELFPGRRMGLYHGAMSREERASARRDLAQGRVDLLLATSLVEEGGPIDGVGAVLVEQADRIDPARLERIRRLASRPESRLVFVVGDAAELRSFEARVSSPTFEGRVPPSDEAGGTPPVLRWNRSASLARIAFVRDIATRLLADDPGLRRAPDLARTLRSRWGDLWPADEDDDKGFPCPVTEVGSAGSGRRRRKRRRR
jgi:ATP-dependent DNA helicase RecG